MEALVGPLSALVEADVSRTDSGLGKTTLGPALGEHPSPRAHNGEAKGEAETDIRKARGRIGRDFGKAVSSLRRRRHSRAHAALGVRHMVNALALALLVVVAVAVLHRLIRCLNGITPEKGSRHRLPGGIVRRLAPEPSDGAEVNAELPTYEEATQIPPLEMWGAPPQYTALGEEPPPPPSYEDACRIHVSTVDRPGSSSGSQATSSVRSDRLMYLLIVLSWLVAIGVTASISGEAGLSMWTLVGIAVGSATFSTVAFLLIFEKFGVKWIRRPRQSGRGASAGTDNLGSAADNLAFEM